MILLDCIWRRMKVLHLRWFLMLLGTGSLLVLFCLQDWTNTELQQNSGSSTPGCCHDNGSAQKGDQTMETPRCSMAKDISPTVSLMPDLYRDNRPIKKPAVTKRHRKLLKTPSGVEEVLQEALQESRRRLLANICTRYRTEVADHLVSQRQVSRVYVEDRSRLLYCEVPKVGCSNWKRVLMVLGGSALSTRDIPHDTAHYANRLRRLESFSPAGIANRLRTYTKVLFVREPFERLVSAFRDKFESPNSYYHPVFGRAIISKYRANATRTALHTGAGVTFREFIQYLLDVQRPVGLDIHWEPVNQLCSPCRLRYDFIGKFESLEDDANFLLRRIGAPDNLTFPDFKDRNPLAERTSSAITWTYFSQLDSTERQKVFDFFYMDYLMFDYPKPFSDLL